MSNSSTLTGPKGVIANDAKSGPKGEPMTPIPSASLIILCPISSKDQKATKSEYSTLMVQRKATGSFRSATVFPGGLLDQADVFAISQSNQSSSFQKNDEYLHSLRLCALRETFEETGLLLVPDESNSFASRAVGPSEAGLSSDEWTKLRKDVHNDARAFTQILNRFTSNTSQTSLPPLAPLRHHSNWVTPRTLVRPAKRFDTHFFLSVLDKADALGQLTSSIGADEKGIVQGSPAGLTADGSETTSLRLAKPEELLSMAIRDEIILFPPQYYLLADIHTSLLKSNDQKQIRFAPLQFGTEKEPEENTSSTQAPSIEGVSSVEPQGVASSGAMIERNRLSVKPSSKQSKEEQDDDDLFVLPLVLPGDELRPTAGQSATVPESDEAPRNRVYVTPRSRGEGGGMMVHGIHRRGITGLHNLKFGNVLPDLEGEGTSEEDLLPARNAKL